MFSALSGAKLALSAVSANVAYVAAGSDVSMVMKSDCACAGASRANANPMATHNTNHSVNHGENLSHPRIIQTLWLL